MTKKKSNTGIQSQDGITVFVTKDGTTTRVANFTLKRKGVGKTAELVESMVEDNGNDFWLVEYTLIGHPSKVLCINNSIFADPAAFKKFFLRHDGSFMGQPRLLSDWGAKLSMENVEDKIQFHVIQDKYGKWKIDNKDIWIFNNGFYFQGEFHEHEDFYEYDNGKKAIKMELDNYKNMTARFNKSIDIPKSIEDIRDIFDDLKVFLRRLRSSSISS
jgi:hypothetical protein